MQVSFLILISFAHLKQMTQENAPAPLSKAPNDTTLDVEITGTVEPRPPQTVPPPLATPHSPETGDRADDALEEIFPDTHPSRENAELEDDVLIMAAAPVVRARGDPPSNPDIVEVAPVVMPTHLAEMDPMWSADEIRAQQKGNSINAISRLRIRPVEKSRLRIPLCRLSCYPKVRPIIETDVCKLANEFVKGYREGDRVLYVSPYSKNGKQRMVKDDDAVWDNPHWKAANDRFEESLVADPDLCQFSGKYFYVYEGNHRVTAWMRYIDQMRRDDPDWYFFVDCIVLDGRAEYKVLIDAMNDINW